MPPAHLTVMRTSRLVVILILALQATGCGTQGTATRTGVEGRTMIDGGCPVLRIDSPCPDRPFPAIVTAIHHGSTAATASTTSDANGHFTLTLAPGDYILRAAPTAGGSPPTALDTEITVPGTGYAQVTIRFDSGIR
jgi:hypothetical protein